MGKIEESQQQELRNLRPSKWSRLKAVLIRVNNRVHYVEALLSVVLVLFIAAMLDERLNPKSIDFGLRSSSLWVAVLAALSLWCTVIFFRRQLQSVLQSTKDSLVTILLLLTSVAAFKITLIFQMDIIAGYFLSVPKSFFLFLIPIAAPAMIQRMLFSGSLIVLFNVLHALFLGFLLEQAFQYGMYVFCVSIMGALFVSQTRTRNSVHLAGFRTAIVSAIAAAVTSLSWGAELPIYSDFVAKGMNFNFSMWEIAGWSALGGFIGGWVSSALAMAVTPLSEIVLDYTTDLKLVELSRMDHPLLRELVMKAPGTYHHSIIVGSLSEAAAESIGANALLVRVGSYYHDIGKIGRAEYFVENQTRGYNPHDHIRPSLSAKIIISHVKDGKALADEYKLGSAISDFIMQHHGRSLVSYFYNKAKQEAAQPDSEVNESEISEEDYRYPGPNPQTKEAAIMALADSCEAATRSLIDPTPARIEAMVTKIITKALNDGLLDEAEITLRELRLVAKAFNRILMSIHHSRIQYPNQEEGMPPQNVTFLGKNVKS